MIELKSEPEFSENKKSDLNKEKMGKLVICYCHFQERVIEYIKNYFLSFMRYKQGSKKEL